MKIIKYSAAIIVLSGLLATGTHAQGHDHSHSNDKNGNKNGMTKNMDVTKKNKDENPVIRKGVIDLKSIDQNKDGKVYQDQMDWNVISDAPGKCPLCKMSLKQVSLQKAKENLIKNGFKVK